MQKTKKIFSALLAIVMLVSVFTFTTSAGAPVPSGSAKVSIAYEVVNADGDVITTVAPGETVTVNVYSNAAAASDTLTEFKISVFFDSKVFVKDDTAIKSSLKWVGLANWVSTAGSTFDVYQAGNTYFDAIVAKATTEELAYGWDTMAYCVGVASGDEDYLVQENADTAMYSFDLKVADNVAAGTSANVGCYAAASYISRTKSYCYIKTPSTGSRIADGAVYMPETQALTVGASCDHSADKLTWTTVTASTCKTAGTEKGVCSCGEYETTRALPLDANNHEGPFTWTTVTAPTYTTAGSEKEVCTACTKDTGNTRPLAIKEFVTGLKGQIRFHKDENSAYAGSFDVRALATIPAAKFEEVFTADKATQKSMIKEVGFVFASGATVTAPSMDAVKGLVENGTAAAGYTKKTVEYISTSLVKDNYTFSCIVTDIPDAQKTNSLVAVGYIAWDSNNDGKVDSYAYYPTAQTISFETLYNTHYNTAFPQA